MKEKLLGIIGVIPFLSHWILPDGMEASCYIRLGSLPFYIFNVFLFVYIILNHQVVKNNIFVSPKIKSVTISVICLLLVYTIYNFAINQVDNFFLLLLNNQSLICASFIYLLFPMTIKMIDSTKYVVVPTLVIVCVEVILYSLGILTYTQDFGGTSYSGVMRVSTTVGGCTGTGVAIIMLAVLVNEVYKIGKKTKIFLLLLTTIAVLFTVSRGPILIWGGYVVIFIYRQYLRGAKLAVKMKFLIYFSIILSTFIYYGLFDPILERNDDLSESSYALGTGREEKNEEGIRLMLNSGGLGIGNGQTNIDKSLRGLVKESNHIGIHNYYITILAELGVFGLMITIFYFLFLIKNFDFTKTFAYYALLLLIVSFSIEPVFTYAEFMMPAFFIIMITLKRKKRSTRSVLKRELYYK